MAAGFTVQREKITLLQKFLNDRYEGELNNNVSQKVRKASGLLSVAGCQSELADWIELIGPFGSSNAEPRFVLPDCRIRKVRYLGESGAHLSCVLDDGCGSLRGIAFQVGGTDMGTVISNSFDGKLFHILGRLRRDRFRGGRAVQFEIDDVAEA